MTPLTKPISRLTRKRVNGRPLIITLAPLGAQEDARIGLRQLGRRTQYVVLVSDLYRIAALWHGQKEQAARRKARKEGVPWSRARKQFIAANSI